MIAPAALGAALAACALAFALGLEPVTAGGRFATDLGPHSRCWILAAGTATAAMAAIAAWALLPDRLASAPVVIAAALAPALAFIDHRAMLLPLPLTCTLTSLGVLGLSIDATRAGTWGQAASGLIAAAGVIALATVFWWSNRHRFGSGDLALIAAIATFLGRHGWAAVIIGVALATFTSCIRWCGHLLLRKKEGVIVPIGPSLIVGWWIAEALVLSG